MAKDDNKPDTTTGTTEGTAKKPKGLSYIGPAYGSAIRINGRGPYNPRSWDKKKIEQMIRLDPALTKYFE